MQTPALLATAAALATALVGGCATSPPLALPPVPPAAPAFDTLLPVNGTRLFVHSEGSGEPVLMVHGGPLLDQGYLVEPFRPLTEHYRLVFYDQRLSGRSDGSVDTASVSLDAFVADMEAVRGALGLETIHLVGHSWGGLLAMKYALTHPHRLRSLILVSPMAPSSSLWRSEQAALARALEPSDTAGLGELRRSQAFEALEPAAVERMLQLSFRAQLHDPQRADDLRFLIPADYGQRSRQFGRMGAELSSYDLVDSLATLRLPTLLVYGASEAAAGIGGAVLRDTLPDVTVRAVHEAGHFSFLEQPERFAALLRDFLAGTRR